MVFPRDAALFRFMQQINFQPQVEVPHPPQLRNRPYILSDKQAVSQTKLHMTQEDCPNTQYEALQLTQVGESGAWPCLMASYQKNISDSPQGGYFSMFKKVLVVIKAFNGRTAVHVQNFWCDWRPTATVRRVWVLVSHGKISCFRWTD